MWKFQMHDAKKYILIGVIDDGKLEQNKNDVVCDFTDTKWNGWGLHLWSTSKCHYYNTDADEESDDKFNHMRTFNLRKDYIYIEYGIGFDTG